MAKFCDRLRFLRNSKNLTQLELSKLLNISKSSINMYERGEREPSFKLLETIADFFNVDLDYLIGTSDLPNKSLLIDSLSDRKVAFPNLPDSTFPESKSIPRIPHASDSGPLSPEEEQILYKYHHGKLLADMTEEEITIIKKFRRLDDRGKSSVLNILNHEYDSLPGEIPSPAPKKA